jgi:hypothetical protein
VTEVFAKHVRRDDLEISMSKLVSAFLAVAEDLVSEESYQAEKDKRQRVVAGPALPLVARSKTPEQGGSGRDTDLDQSEPNRGTKRRTA